MLAGRASMSPVDRIRPLRAPWLRRRQPPRRRGPPSWGTLFSTFAAPGWVKRGLPLHHRPLLVEPSERTFSAHRRNVRDGPFASFWPRVDRFRSTPPKADMRTGVRWCTPAIIVRAVLRLTVWMGGHEPATLTPFGKGREGKWIHEPEHVSV
jgi:hypothetical protein